MMVYRILLQVAFKAQLGLFGGEAPAPKPRRPEIRAVGGPHPHTQKVWTGSDKPQPQPKPDPQPDPTHAWEAASLRHMGRLSRLKNAHEMASDACRSRAVGPNTDKWHALARLHSDQAEAIRPGYSNPGPKEEARHDKITTAYQDLGHPADLPAALHSAHGIDLDDVIHHPSSTPLDHHTLVAVQRRRAQEALKAAEMALQGQG